MSTLSALDSGKNLEFEENYLLIHSLALHIDQWVKILSMKSLLHQVFIYAGIIKIEIGFMVFSMLKFFSKFLVRYFDIDCSV